MYHLSYYSVGVSSDYRVGELFIDLYESVSRLSRYSVGLSSDYRVGELFIDCKSRCPVCHTIESVYRLTIGLENYLSTYTSRCPVCLAIHSVYRLTIGLENYLSTARVGVPSVVLFSRCIV